MTFLYNSFVVVITTCIVYELYVTLDSRWQKWKFARRHGCQPVPKFPSAPFTNTFDREVNKSYRNGHVNRTTLEHYHRVGSLTYGAHTRTGYQICTADPVNHQVIASKITEFIRPQYGSVPFFGDHMAILYQSAGSWKRTRDLTAPLFKRVENKDMKQFRKFVDRFISLIPQDRTFDVQPLMRKLFFDSSTEFIFGKSIDSLRDQTPKSEAFIETYNRALIGAGRQERPHTLSLWEWLGVRNDAWLADCKVVHDYIDSCIAHHRSFDRLKSEAATENNTNHSERYVLIEGMSEEIADPVELRFHLLGIFTMAHETLAMACSNVLFMLARNPKLWTELRRQAVALGPDLTYDQTQNLTLFRNTVLETLRLHSPITRITRTAMADTVLPRGGGPDGSAPTFIPRGTAIRLDWFPKFQDPTIWGPDVDAFRPSRFDGRQLNPDALPFSSGPRMCPANQMVLAQSVYLLVRLTQAFERIENRDSCLEFIEGVLICYESRNGCKVAFRCPNLEQNTSR